MAIVIEFYIPKNFGNRADGGSAATRKNHRVLPTDEEISLAASQGRWRNLRASRSRIRNTPDVSAVELRSS